jgi:hypothetical protein
MNPRGHQLQGIMARIKNILSQLDKVSLFYIKRALKKEADAWEKLATLLNPGSIMENGEYNYATIP